jgi:prepilin peptidase CpaA
MILPVILCEAGLALLLLFGATKDALSFRLPNWLTLASAVLALILVALTVPDHLILHAGFALAVFVVGLAAFHFNLLGGGDIKWIAALALWIGPHLDFIRFIIVMGLAGGVLAGVVYIVGRVRPGYGRADGPSHLPYGVAIAVAGLDYMGRRGMVGQELLAWL